MIEEKISMSHARVLSKLENKEEIVRLANKIVDENLNVRDIEDLSKDDSIEKSHKIKKREPNEYEYIQNIMCEKLGTKVKITSNKINISFNNINDLNRILEILNISE